MFEQCTASSDESEKVSREKFTALVDDYSVQVLNTAVRILGDPEKAMDVHQDVFLAIWKRWHTYNGQTNWEAYLYRATVRKAIEFARRSRRSQSLRRESGESISRERPEGSLRASELHQRLAGCLAKLPKRQADVFVLTRLEGLKAENVAELLGCSQKTVRVHLHRAVKRLAHQLGDYLMGSNG
jgi:RNA polymerase sigma-70 factor (ECF subfamily)